MTDLNEASPRDAVELPPRASAPSRSAGVTIVVASALGLLAAATLLVEKITLLQDPEYVPTCSLNPVVSCGSVMTSAQAEAFGVPNPLLGVIGFSLVLATGAALLAGARLARWYWDSLLVGTALGTAFVHWLVFQSLYRINALCPYCMVVWVVTLVLLVTVARHTLTLAPATTGLARFAQRNHAVLVTAWCLVVITLALIRFWDYWRTLLP